MARKNERLELKIVTPRGVAIYPQLNTPSTKFEKDGMYECRLKFNPDEANDGVLNKKTTPWSELKAAIDAQQAEFLKAKKAELAKGDGKAKKKAKEIENVEWGVEPDVDDEGTETGLIVIKAKMKASGKNAKGEEWTRKPKLFDAKSKPLSDKKPIWGGSVLKIAGTVVPYYNAKDNVVGSTMYLDAVQVLELVSGQGREAGDYGFGEEDGYTAEDEEAPFDADGDDGEGGDGDF